MTPDQDPKTTPTEPRHSGDWTPRDRPGDEPETLQNEYRGEADKDGIPANGTTPTEPRGPDDVGA